MSKFDPFWNENQNGPKMEKEIKKELDSARSQLELLQKIPTGPTPKPVSLDMRFADHYYESSVPELILNLMTQV